MSSSVRSFLVLPCTLLHRTFGSVAEIKVVSNYINGSAKRFKMVMSQHPGSRVIMKKMKNIYRSVGGTVRVRNVLQFVAAL